MNNFIEMLGLAMVLQAAVAAIWNNYKGRDWHFWAFLCLFNLGWLGVL